MNQIDSRQEQNTTGTPQPETTDPRQQAQQEAGTGQPVPQNLIIKIIHQDEAEAITRSEKELKHQHKLPIPDASATGGVDMQTKNIRITNFLAPEHRLRMTPPHGLENEKLNKQLEPLEKLEP